MPQWDITDQQSGDTFTIEAEQEPSQADLLEIVQKHRAPKIQPEDQPGLEKAAKLFAGMKLSPYEQQVLGMGGRVSEPPIVDVPELAGPIKQALALPGKALDLLQKPFQYTGFEVGPVTDEHGKTTMEEVPGAMAASERDSLIPPPPEGARGILPSIQKFGAGMTTRGSLATLPVAAVGGPAGKAAQALFAASAGAGVVDAAEELARAETPAEKRGALTDLVLQGGMAALMGKGLVKGREKIVSAAYRDEAGNVHAAANHPQIVEDLGLEGFDTRESRNTDQFGYWTNKKRFVTRPQAARIVKISGQQLEPFDVDAKGQEQPHSDEIESPKQPGEALGDVEQPVQAKPFFDVQSEALGLGRPSTAPTVEDVRAQRAQESSAPETSEVVLKTEVPRTAKKWIAITTSSHRQVKRIHDSMKVEGGGLPVALGSNVRAWRVEDTPENRATAQRLKLPIRAKETKFYNELEQRHAAPTKPTKPAAAKPPKDPEVTEPETPPGKPAAAVEPPKPPVIPPAPPAEETGGGQKYGIAARVRAERAAAGQVEPVEPGQGVSAPDSVEHGRQLLVSDAQAGVKALEKFEADPEKGISADAMAATRAHGEYLAKAARDMEDRYGTDSEQYRAVRKTLSDWDKRTKPMQTEWHKIGKAQQGETDIDTGSFTGLSRAYESATGEQFTPKQEKQAKEIADKKKKADASAAAAEEATKKEIANAVSPDRASMTDAERRAFDAANKAVREWAVRRAQAENKARVADEKLKQAVEKVQADAKRKADSSRVVRDAARRLAAAESKARVATASDKAVADAQVKAAKDALEAAHKTVREAAVAEAKRENAKRVAAVTRAKQVADVQVDAAKRAEEAASKTVRDAARRSAEKARKDLAMDPHTRVLAKAREYIDQLGMDNLDEIRNKIATELGMKVDDVNRFLAKTPKIKFMLNDVWNKKQVQRKLEQAAKQWLTNQAIPWYRKALKAIPRLLFGLKVGFHGTVALGTHAPTLAFRPPFWKMYGQNFAKMYRMVGAPSRGGQATARAYYEQQVQDLIRKKNYIVGRRAGLQNDPFQAEELTAAKAIGPLSTVAKISAPFAKAFNAMTDMGNRGYFVLKLLRQDLFDHHWNRLPKTLQYPEMAQAISDAVNHDTGVTKAKGPPGSEIVLFAPRLEASRLAWLVADPGRALATGLNWKNASTADKWFAIEQVKGKAWVAGTLYSLLAANQGLINATNSDQKVNFTDPFRADFLKFKIAGMNVSYGNPMLTLIRMPSRLWRIRSKSGKSKSLVYPDEKTYDVLGEYGRSQMSPVASLATTLWLQSDYQNRPFEGSDQKMPKRLRAQGIEPYTWPEFLAETALPIPFEEAAREVWKTGMGMNEEQVQQMLKAMATLSVMSATGARVTEDVPYSADIPPRPLP